MVDPQNRLCEYFFTFLITYGQDEETLIHTNAGYIRWIGV